MLRFGKMILILFIMMFAMSLTAAHAKSSNSKEISKADPGSDQRTTAQDQESRKSLAVGDVNVVPLEVNGDPEDRLNLVIFGDGYTAEEMDTFHEDVDRNLNVMWASEPFRSYRNYFNLYMVETPSKDSGISCDPDDENIRRNTVFNLQYANECPADELARGITFGSGGDEARAEIMEDFVVPELGISSDSQNIQSLTLANTFTYGGIGGTTATTSGGSPQGPLVSLHELGHSLGELQDEYPYNDRDVPGSAYSGEEPDSIHHTLMTSEEMIAKKAKWWNWLGEESLSGGTIDAADSDGHESGLYSNSNIWRPSKHSKMRAIGFYFDQIGREQMTQRISGMRDAGEMPVSSIPEGEVGSEDVVWAEVMHPRFHELDVTWEINGETVQDTHNRNYLHLADMDVEAGDNISVKVEDKTDFVRDSSFLEGPRMTQTREWTVGEPLEEEEVKPEITTHTSTERSLAYDEVVYLETTHPTQRVFDVAWEIDGKTVENTHNSRTLNLDEQPLPKGSSELSATVTDPSDPDGSSETITWTVDNGLPTTGKKLSEPLTTLSDDIEHNVYFNAFDMQLESEDDQKGFVVGELRLDEDGWYNYYGFPEEPLESPFHFSHSGTERKGITYGNLGTGGLTKTAFEQSYTEEDPGGPFIPGFGTHTVEHRAIDAAGNIGKADKFKATVLPGEELTCANTITGNHDGDIHVKEGVTCLEDAHVEGNVSVQDGASLMATDSTIDKDLRADEAQEVQLFGTTVDGQTRIAETKESVTLAGNSFKSSLTLFDNNQISANEQYGEYGPVVVSNAIGGPLACDRNSSEVNDFGVKNDIDGPSTGGCADQQVKAKDMKELVDYFEQKEAFDDDDIIHALKVHLTSVAYYEKQKEEEKVVKHMKGFKKLLDNQKDRMSEVAYDNLNADTNSVIEKRK